MWDFKFPVTLVDSKSDGILVEAQRKSVAGQELQANK